MSNAPAPRPTVIEMAARHTGHTVIEMAARHTGHKVIEMAARHTGHKVIEMAARHTGHKVIEMAARHTMRIAAFAGTITATRGRSSEAVCVLRDGDVTRPQMSLFDNVCRPHRWSSRRGAWSWRARAYADGREQVHCIPAMSAREARARAPLSSTPAGGSSGAPSAPPGWRRL